MNKYREHLYEIFSKDPTFNLTFDEIEQLVDEKMETDRSDVIAKYIEKGLDETSSNKNPDGTCLCVCGTSTILCRNKEGKPKVFERTIQTKRGHVKIKEYGYYCSKCRKIFFSYEKKIKTTQRELQS